jgi:DnaJ-class molecular chaperone
MAYDALSDAKKRATYDRYGEEGLKQGFVPPEARPETKGMGAEGRAPGGGFRAANGGGGFGFPGGGGFHEFTGADAEDLFARFFGGGGGGGGGARSPFGGMGDAFGASAGVGSKRRRPECVLNLECTLEELFRGGRRNINYARNVRAGTSGQVAQKDAHIAIDFKPGWKDGTKITFAGKGHEDAQTGQAADLVVVIKETPHKFLRRDGDDLVYEVPQIALRSALIGWKVEFVNVDGETVRLSFDDPTPPGTARALRGKGMPNQKTGQRGDLIVTENKVTFPSHLNSKQKALLREAFAPGAAA